MRIYRFFTVAIFSFILYSTIIVFNESIKPSPYAQIHREILIDLVDEVPNGRQAMVNSLHIMPLPIVISMPFLLLFPPSQYNFAYLLSLAFIAAGGTATLTSIMRKNKTSSASFLSILIFTILCALTANTIYANLIVLFTMLIMAIRLETDKNKIVKSLAGIFYGLCFFSHALGALVVAIKLIAMLAVRIFYSVSEGKKAVQLIQTFSIIYILLIYLFLSSMIMKDPFYAIKNTSLIIQKQIDKKSINELNTILNEKYSDFTPMFSGQWGYLLKMENGMYFMDFYPENIPDWQKNSTILILPTKDNPLICFSDISVRLNANGGNLQRFLLKEKTKDWLFYLINRPIKD